MTHGIPTLKPRYATRRNPDRPTDGGKVARIAELMGTPLLPWQKLVCDVFDEIDPATGTYWYDQLVLSVQRQAGKTTRDRAENVRNALWGPNRRVWYLAQTGKDASEQFREFTDQFGKSKLARLARQIRRANGSQSLILRNGSQIRPGGTTDSSGHGFQGDSLTLDECWALSADTAKNILDGFLPTTATRLKTTGVRPRITFCSTEGNAHSTFYNNLLDDLRARMTAGEDLGRTCFFDFGIPFDADPEDMDTVWEYHPAAGLLFDFDQLRDFRNQFRDDAAGWARSFGNLRDAGVVERVVDRDLWSATEARPITPDADTKVRCFGVAVSMGCLSTAIVALVETPRPMVQVVATLDGIGRAPAELERLQSTYHAPLAIDRRGPSAVLADTLTRATDHDGTPRFDLLDLKTADYVAAPQAFVTALEQRELLHATDVALDAEIAVASKRVSGDSWLWSRREDDGTPCVEAASLAWWAYKHLPEPVALQIF